MAYIKTYRLSLFIFTAILFLNSCKKDKQTDLVSQLNGAYRSDAYFTLSNIQMFTTNGQVQDAALIGDFIKRRKLDFTTGETEPLNSEMGAINFDGDGNATINLPDGKGTLIPTKFSITDKTTSSFILRQNNNLRTSVTDNDNRVARLVETSNLIDQTVNCQMSLNGHTQCDYVRRLPFTLSNNAINLSYYSIAIYGKQPGLEQLAAVTDAPGIFNKNITGNLIAGDTLVVQSKYLRFSKN